MPVITDILSEEQADAMVSYIQQNYKKTKKVYKMLDVIQSLLHFIIQAGEFILFTVFVKMIFAKWIAEKVLRWLQTKNYRNAAIWEHYNHDHPGEVTECGLEKCADLQQVPTSIPQMA